MRRQVGLAATLTAVATFGLGLVACGSGRRERVVAQIGETTITNTGLARLIATMAPEHVVLDPPGYGACIAHEEAFVPQSAVAELKEECQREYQTVKQQALDHLISTAWLIGEAAEQGLRISKQEIEQQLKHRRDTLAAGVATGDAELEVKAELAARKLGQVLTMRERPITDDQIARYYRRHSQRFLIPERRYFDIAEVASEGAAMKLKAEVEAGRSLAHVALHESLKRPTATGRGDRETAIERAIFTAKPHVLGGPVRLVPYRLHAVFEVTRVIPASYRPLAEVEAAIKARLFAEQQQRTRGPLIDRWTTTWIAKTDCRSGFIVSKCRQYRGSRAGEPDPFALVRRG